MALSQQQLLCAKLHFEGNRGEDIATALNRGKRTIERWLSLAEVKAEVERLGAVERQEIDADIKESLTFQREVRKATRERWRACAEKITEAIEAIPAESVWRQIPALVKAGKELDDNALSVEDSTLGLEELSKELDGLTA